MSRFFFGSLMFFWTALVAWITAPINVWIALLYTACAGFFAWYSHSDKAAHAGEAD